MQLLSKFTAPRNNNDHLLNRIHHADLLELCRAIGDNSIDMILCDLPYG
jgi:hypothetical protein